MYILAIDLGTQSIRAAVVSGNGVIKGISQIRQTVDSPQIGWAQQKPEIWWGSAARAARDVLEKTGISPKSISGVISCGQMHGPVGLDEKGHVVTQWTQLWCDKRCEEQCDWVRENFDVNELSAITANQPTPGWVALKVRWIMEHQPDAYKRSRWFLVPKDFINYCLTGIAATDPSEASGTYLWDADKDQYSPEMAAILGLDLAKFAPVLPAHEIIGGLTDLVATQTGLLAGTPVVCGGGDFLVSLLGFGMIGESNAIDITGTSTLFVVHRERPIIHPFIQNLRHVAGGWVPFFMLDSGGIALKWCRELLSSTGKGEVSYEEMIAMADLVALGSRGLVFYPYLFGERRRENTHAQGAFFGITQEHGAPHFARAVMEGVALSIGMNFGIFKKLGIAIEQVTCSGGGTRNRLLTEIKANVLDLPLEISDEPESTIRGSGLLGALATGLIDDVNGAADTLKKGGKRTIVKPTQEKAAAYQELQKRFNKIYDRMVGFYKDY